MTDAPTRPWVRLRASWPVRGLLVVVLAGCSQAPPSANAEHSPSDLPTALPTASQSPTPGPFGAADLPRIVLSEDHLEPGMTLDDVTTGIEALIQPVALLEMSTFRSQPGFVDARMTRIGTSGPGSYWEEGGYVTWTALYASPTESETAFEVLVAEHESAAGWAMQRVGSPPHGDEGISLEGAAYGFDANLLHIWRDENLVLAAGAFGVTAALQDASVRLGSIAEGMAARAN
ncbi:MAG TPA: hypothetical protein VFP83_00430 [Candidatus Limnocylindria bacterium]|nr:hypothetical protein [Candidatus Limnocylindria bacterium]